MGFKAYMLFKSERPSTNSLTFATREEADAYGSDLLSRWTTPIGYKVRETDEQPTDQWIPDQGLRKIGSDATPRMPPRSVLL